jgi:hypothetical protein
MSRNKVEGEPAKVLCGGVAGGTIRRSGREVGDGEDVDRLGSGCAERAVLGWCRNKTRKMKNASGTHWPVKRVYGPKRNGLQN